MASKNKPREVTKFQNVEEEDKFWQEHSPLLGGPKGKVQKKGQNRASFLSIRLTGKELDNLRIKAAEYGLAPSTYARQVLKQALESPEKYLPPELLFLLSRSFPGERREDFYKKIQDIYDEYLKIQKEFANTLSLCMFSPQEEISIDEKHRQKEVKH